MPMVQEVFVDNKLTIFQFFDNRIREVREITVKWKSRFDVLKTLSKELQNFVDSPQNREFLVTFKETAWQTRLFMFIAMCY